MSAPAPPCWIVDQADLPASAVELIGAIGMPAAIRLIEAMPGVLFPVPAGENNNPAGAARFAQLAEVVGEAAARQLVRVYGGREGMYVPGCRRAILRARNRLIVAEYTGGQAILDLALRWRLSCRQIESILAATDTTPARETVTIPRQMSLLD